MFFSYLIVEKHMHSISNINVNRFREISDNYDVFFVDLWGVLHNGVECHKDALVTLEQLKKKNKTIILISNAPRPSKTVSFFLEKLKLPKHIYDFLITSGDMTREYLISNCKNKTIYHLGPERDKDLFNDMLIKIATNKEECDEIICTGLFDSENENIQKYNEELSYFRKNHRRLICANPDEVVVRGTKMEYCAGALANKYKYMGGEVVYFGKPYLDIYYSALQKLDIFEKFKEKKIKLFSIGDNLKTDIQGANMLGIDSLLILNGIYKDFFKKNAIDFEKLKQSTKISNLKINYYQENLLW